MGRVIIIITLLLAGCQSQKELKMNPQKNTRNLHHFNFRTAFMSGFYEGEYTMKQLLQKGDFGLGTFNNLEGEMIVLDGKIYRATSDGLATKVNDFQVKTPSAMVTFFEADREITFTNLTRDKLITWINENLDTQRDMYALKVTGSFASLKARSQDPIYEKPFPEIEAVVDNMVYHDLKEVSGTLVGFQLPPYLENINYPGLHFHFVGQGETQPAGGCAPAFTIKQATLSIMKLHAFSVDIPQTPAYYKLEMDQKKNKVM